MIWVSSASARSYEQGTCARMVAPRLEMTRNMRSTSPAVTTDTVHSWQGRDLPQPLQSGLSPGAAADAVAAAVATERKSAPGQKQPSKVLTRRWCRSIRRGV